MNYNRDKVILIITACISPNTNQRHLVLKDVDERLRQYLDSIYYYLRESFFKKIIFCDNSGYDYNEIGNIIDFASSIGKELEWLSFKGNSDLVAKYSTKGIGEDEIMDYIFTNSKLVIGAKSFVKVTGRLLVQNVDALLYTAQYGKNYFYRNIYSDDFHELDTRFYVMDIDYYNLKVRNCYNRIKDYDMSMELVYSKLIHNDYALLSHYPRIKGCSGGVGTDYGKESEIKLFIFDVLCKLNIFNHCSWLIILYIRTARKIRTLLKRPLA